MSLFIDGTSCFSKSEWLKGMEYAKTSWKYTYNRMGESSITKRLERIALGLGIGEPAFKYFLNNEKIKFDLSGRTLWYQSDLNDFMVNSLKIDAKVHFLNEDYKFVQKNFISKTEKDKINHILNNCYCLVPSGKTGQLNKDIYCFVLAEGKWVTKDRLDLFTNYQTSNLEVVHLFWDYKWTNNNTNKTKSDFDPNGKKLGKLKITKADPNDNIKFKLYGTSRHTEFYSEIIEIKKGEKFKYTKGEFDNVFSCSQLLKEPKKQIIVESEKINFSEPIDNWKKLKFQCSKISILGFTSKKDLQIKGISVPRYHKESGFYSDTGTPNLKIKTKDLMPMSEFKKFVNAKQHYN